MSYHSVTLASGASSEGLGPNVDSRCDRTLARDRATASARSSPDLAIRASVTSDPISVFVHSSDPVLQAGIVMQMRGRHDIRIVEDLDAGGVALVVADEIDEDTTRICRAVHRNGGARVVIVATHIDEAALLTGVEAGASGFLRRSEVDPDRLAAVVKASACGDGSVPPDLIGRLLSEIGRLQAQLLSPRGLSLSGFSEREIDVLRMVADGFGTAEIAGRLCYSERTVKGIIHEITTRFQLKNRAQAVAYAVRHGLI
jgi:DNA-binding NarL/FixJ family response regulator